MGRITKRTQLVSLKRIPIITFFTLVSILQVFFTEAGWLICLNIVRTHASGKMATILSFDMWNGIGLGLGLFFVYFPFLIRIIDVREKKEEPN